MLLDDFYEILDLKSEDNQTVTASVKINKTHKIFVGHFPKNPVTPGVLMLQIIKNCLEIHLEKPLLIQRLSHVKFLAFGSNLHLLESPHNHMNSTNLKHSLLHVAHDNLDRYQRTVLLFYYQYWSFSHSSRTTYKRALLQNPAAFSVYQN